MLCCRISCCGYVHARRYDPVHGSDVDDGPAAFSGTLNLLFQHDGKLFLLAPPHAVKVDVKDFGPFILSDLMSPPPRAANACVVDSHVQATESLDGLSDARLHLVGVSYVHLQWQYFYSGVLLEQ